MSEIVAAIILPMVIAIFGSSGFWSWMQSKRDKSSDILKSVKEVKTSVGEIEKRVTTIEDNNAETEAKNCRNRIVRFADEIRKCEKGKGEYASRDYYDHILVDIDTYERYCDSHPNFYNSIAKVSISKIMEHYQRGDFL